DPERGKGAECGRPEPAVLPGRAPPQVLDAHWVPGVCVLRLPRRGPRPEKREDRRFRSRVVRCHRVLGTACRGPDLRGPHVPLPGVLHVVSRRSRPLCRRHILHGGGTQVRLLRRMLLQQFLPIFVLSLVFFILLLQLIDIFGSIWRYFAHDVSVGQVAGIALMYLPKCVSFALPVSFLFAIAYTLGLFYANNELFAIFGSGVSLYRLVLPFLILGAALSVGGFFFEDEVVIPTFQAKNEMYSQAVRQVTTLSQSNVAVTSPDQRVVYVADYYNDALRRLTGITVVIRDDRMTLL